MRSFFFVVFSMVAACGVEGEALESADPEAQLRGAGDLDIVIRNLGTDGEACTTEPTGAVTCLSDSLRRPSPVGIGDFAALPVYECDVLADGSLAGCQEETAQHQCHPDEGSGGWCECSGLVNCALMVLSGACTEQADCDENGCACT